MIFLALPQKKKKEFSRMQKLLRTGELMSGWEKYIRKVEPYTPGEQPNLAGMIKLNTNECPYTARKKGIRAACRTIGGAETVPGFCSETAGGKPCSLLQT